MNLKKVSFGVYVFIILLLLGYGTYYEFYNRQFDNIVDKDIVVTKVDKTTSKNGIVYTILDSENKTYFFSSAEESPIFDSIVYRNNLAELSIKYNMRNNEISEVSNDLEINHIKKVNWGRDFALVIIVGSIFLYLFLKKAIVNEWFFRSNRSNIK